MAKKNRTPQKEEQDPNQKMAAEQADEDIQEDQDLQVDNSDTADLDEGELAKADNSND
jgi:hypothetical protein